MSYVLIIGERQTHDHPYFLLSVEEIMHHQGWKEPCTYCHGINYQHQSTGAGSLPSTVWKLLMFKTLGWCCFWLLKGMPYHKNHPCSFVATHPIPTGQLFFSQISAVAQKLRPPLLQRLPLPDLAACLGSSCLVSYGLMAELRRSPVDMVGYPIFSRVLYIPGGAGVLKHQQSDVIMANYNDLTAEVTWKDGSLRESPPNPLSPGLGIILICPDVTLRLTAK